MGENSKQLAAGLIVGLEGSWTAGVAGARKLYAPGVGNVLVVDVTAGEKSELVQIITMP